MRTAGNLAASLVLHLLVLGVLAEVVAVIVPLVPDRPITIRFRSPEPTVSASPPASEPGGGDGTSPRGDHGEAARPPEGARAVATPPSGTGTGSSRSSPAIVEPIDSLSNLAPIDIDRPQTGALLGNRDATGRGAGVGRYGGDGAGEAAVDLGLKWLAAHQAEDGRWSPRKYIECCPPGAICGLPDKTDNYSVGLTGLVLLAFFGAGHAGETGPYQATVRRALEWLFARQDESGFFLGSSQYDHGVCTLALAEGCAMTGDPRLRRPLERAVAAMLSTQRPGGGWHYRLNLEPGRTEFTMSVWHIMALKAASLAGVHVSPDVFDRARGLVRSSTLESGGVDYGRGFPTQGATLAGLFSRCILAIDDFETFEKSFRFADQSVEPSLDGPQGWRNYYAWYYRTLVSFQIQGPRWRAWNGRFRKELVSRQRKGEHVGGSWALDRDQIMGPLYSTAMSVLMLEVYYRYLPMRSSQTTLGMMADTIDSEQLRDRAAREALFPSRAARLDRLRKMLQGSKSEDRYLAARELASGDDPDLLAEMIVAAGKEPGALHAAFVRMIGQLKRPEALPFLLRELSDRREEVRTAALNGLRAATGQAFSAIPDWEAWLRRRPSR